MSFVLYEVYVQCYFAVLRRLEIDMSQVRCYHNSILCYIELG